MKNIWKNRTSIEELQKWCKNTLVSHLKIVFTEMGSDYLKAEMALGPHVMQPMGTMHGGASCVLAETVANAAGHCCIDAKTQICVGLDINTNHICPALQGLLTATAKPYHLGRRTQVWAVEIHDQDHQLISVSRVTLSILQKEPV